MTLRVACERLAEDDDLEHFCECDTPTVLPGDILEALDSASDILSNLAWSSHRLKLGRCTYNIRPCSELCRTPGGGCCTSRGVRLDGTDPAVTQVRIDGVIIDPITYAVITRPDGSRWLERFKSDGRPDVWPGCQRIGLAATEEHTFEVTYTAGVHKNLLMRWAVAEIACDILGPLSSVRHHEDLPDGTTGAFGYGLSIQAARNAEDTEGQPLRHWLGLGFVQRFLASLPRTQGATIWAPEIADGYDHLSR